MDNLIFSLNATLPIFIVMMVGWGFRQCGVISDSFASQMNRFVFQIALPVSLFTQLYDADVREIWDTRYVVFCFAATLVSILIAVLAARLCADQSDRAEFVQGAYRSSASLLGMAYIELIYGKATTGALMMIGCVPLYNVAAVIILSAGQEERGHLSKSDVSILKNSAGISKSSVGGLEEVNGLSKADANLSKNAEESLGLPLTERDTSAELEGKRNAELKVTTKGKLRKRREAGTGKGSQAGKTALKIVTNPIILGIVIGFAWSLTGLGLPKVISTSCSYIGRLASPLGLLSMGAQLDFKKMFGKVRPAIVGSFLKLIGFTAIFIPVAVQLGFTGEKLVAALIMLGSPATVAGYIMAKNMGHDGTLSASIVMITTLLSSLTLTFWLWLLRSRGLV